MNSQPNAQEEPRVAARGSSRQSVADTSWPPPGMTRGQITLACVRWDPAPRHINSALYYPRKPPLNDLLAIREAHAQYESRHR